MSTFLVHTMLGNLTEIVLGLTIGWLLMGNIAVKCERKKNEEFVNTLARYKDTLLRRHLDIEEEDDDDDISVEEEE